MEARRAETSPLGAGSVHDSAAAPSAAGAATPTLRCASIFITKRRCCRIVPCPPLPGQRAVAVDVVAANLSNGVDASRIRANTAVMFTALADYVEAPAMLEFLISTALGLLKMSESELLLLEKDGGRTRKSVARRLRMVFGRYETQCMDMRAALAGLEAKGSLDADYLQCGALAVGEVEKRLRKLMEVARRDVTAGWSLAVVRSDDNDGLERVREELADHEAGDAQEIGVLNLMVRSRRPLYGEAELDMTQVFYDEQERELAELDTQLRRLGIRQEGSDEMLALRKRLAALKRNRRKMLGLVKKARPWSAERFKASAVF